MTEKKQISIIVAIAEDYGIGKNNQLLWHITDDLKRFKKITSGHTVVMGKNTYLSLPFRPLPNRKNIIITDVPGETFDGCDTVYSIPEAIEKMDENSENFIMGGASIYRQFFGIAQKLYITKVHIIMEADTFFPEICHDEWELQEENEKQTDANNGLQYTFLTFIKKEK
ncbi:MAG TPA: dihydrofolate reductase [Bacteroidales bacterium]|nr:dihydrofolate reductase [Bacteroidales bacterium]